MPKMKLAVTTTTAVTTAVALKPTVRRMLLDRLEEHAKLQKQVTELSGKKTKKNPLGGRMKRLEAEVQELFRKEKQGKALLAGTELDGHKVKLVMGRTKKFDAEGFMKKHGLSQADFDEFTDYTDNEPYVKFTHPGDDDAE